MRDLFKFLPHHCLTVLCSVRAKLRNAEPGFDFTSNFLLRCLYLDERGDPASPQVGFLQGPYLLRVQFFLSHPHYTSDHWLFQTYQHIFTSPSSASDEKSKSKSKPEPTARRRDVASMLCMGGHVTGRSIAYAATQVRQASLAPIHLTHHLTLLPEACFSTKQCTGVDETPRWLSLSNVL